MAAKENLILWEPSPAGSTPLVDKKKRGVNYTDFQSLSPGRKGLVRLMQSIKFGIIKKLHILEGEPILEPAPRIMREVKFGGDNGSRPEAENDNFELKVQVREMFAHLDRIDSMLLRKRRSG